MTTAVPEFATPSLDAATDVGWWMNVFDALPDATFISHAETGRIQVANPACERLLGYELHQIIGHTTMELGMFLNKRQRDKLVYDCLVSGSVIDAPFFAANRNAKFGQFSIREVSYRGVRTLINIIREKDIS